MRTMLISYDLRQPETSADYATLIKAIKTYPWCKVMYSLWLVLTNLSDDELVAHLWRHMDSNDRLLVVDVTGDRMHWQGLPRDVQDWIIRNNPAR